MTPPLVGVVLAGGASTRMGRAKALLSLPDGKTFLEHALAKLTAMTELQMIVGGDCEHFPAAVRAFPHTPDIHPGLGPLAGIESALTSKLGRSYLFIAADQPRLPTELLARLCNGDPDRIHAFLIDEVIIPLPIYVPGQTLAGITEILESENRSLRRFIESTDPLLINLNSESRAYFESINTPEDYRNLVI